MNSGHSQKHGKRTPGVFLQEEGTAFKNSSEKQKLLMSSSPGGGFCFFCHKISMSNSVMKTIRFFPNDPDLQEEQKHFYRKTFLYNLSRKTYHV